MREFSEAVVQFVWDFATADVKKALGCTQEEAADVLKRSASKYGRKPSANQGKHYYKAKAPVAVREEPAPTPIKHVKGEYSNRNAWDDYMEPSKPQTTPNK